MSETFGKYELLAKIGQGGMAEVFLARATLAQGLHKNVVFKKIHPAFSSSNHFVSMFVDEAKVAADLNHPNIAQVFDFGNVGGVYYLVMEYVEGIDLMRLVKAAHQAGRRLPPGIGAYIVQELMKALDYAHRKVGPNGVPLDIVHRDVSPQNVLVSYDGAVKLVDFGIAKTRTMIEEEGIVKGKYAYMAPEQAAGHSVDRRCDIFAAGIILYELTVGRTLFGGLKGEEALKAVRTAEIPMPRKVDESVPEALEAIIMQALGRRPEDRYPTARDFQNALTRFLYSQSEIFDASALAGFVAAVVPEEGRITAASAPAAEAPAAAGPVELPGPGDSLVREAPAGASPTDIVERKKVLLLTAAVPASPGAEPAAARAWASAVGRFGQVAEGIVFKFSALIGRREPTGLTAVVGLPVASEEDGSRAITLARALLDAFTASCHDVTSGPALGVSVCRGFADVARTPSGAFDYRLRTQLIQRGLLLASRAKPGEILVDESVQKAAAEEWAFAEVPLLSQELGEVEHVSVAVEPTHESISGSMPARVFRLTGHAEATGEAAGAQGTPLLGRVLELKALEDAFWTFQRLGRGRVVLIQGEKGMGKRTLVRAFLARAGHFDGLVVRVSARPSGQMVAYGLLSDLCTHTLLEGGRNAGTTLRERLVRVAEQMLPERPADRVPLIIEPLGHLLGLASEAETARRDPDELHLQIQDALYRLIAFQARQRPLVIVLENVHMASPLSVQGLRSLCGRLRDERALVVLTATPLEADHELLKGLDALPIFLGELSPEERTAMVLAHFARPEDAADLASQVVARAGGNPFYIEAILESLVEQGICAPDPTDPKRRLRWTGQEAQAVIPATVEALVASRLDRLPPDLRELLRKASVFGRVVETPHLEALVGEPVQSGLAELERRRLMFGVPGYTDRWAFAQQVIQEVAYFSIAPDGVAALHLEVARILLADPRHQPGPADARVARHLELGRDKAEAVKRYLSAAFHARNVSGNRECYQLLTLAMDLQPEDPRTRFLIHRERQQILRGWGRRRKQQEEIDAMLALARQLGDGGMIAVALNRGLRFDQDGGEPERVVARFDDTMTQAVLAGDLELQADTLRLRARSLNELGRNDEALDSVAKAIRLLPELEADQPSRMRGELLHTQGNIQFYTGRVNEALESYVAALGIFRKLGFRRLEGNMLMNIGFVSQCMGDYEGALAYYQESYNIDLQLGDRFQTGMKVGNIGQAFAEIGQYDRAEKHLKKAIELCRQVEDVSGLSDVLTTLGQVRLYQGQVPAARKLFNESLEVALKAQSAYSEMRSRIYLGMAKLEGGEPAESAIQEGSIATELSRRSDMPQGVVFGLMIMARALSSLGRKDEALQRSSEAMALVATGTPIVGVEEALHEHAKVLRDLGRTTEARPFLERALKEIRKKVRRLKPERQQSFLAVKPIRDVLASYALVIGPVDDLLTAT